jgi:hypothetical protein
MKGAVQEVTTKAWNGKTFYSFKSGGEWYSTGTKKPPAEGQYIEFEFVTNAKGYKDVKNFTLLQGSSIPQGVEKATEGARAVTKDDYWSAKEARDIEYQRFQRDVIQPKIETQAARNAAIEWVKFLTSATFAGKEGMEAAITMPAKAKRKEFLDALLEEYMTKFKAANTEVNVVNKAMEDVIDNTEGAVQTEGDWN